MPQLGNDYTLERFLKLDNAQASGLSGQATIWRIVLIPGLTWFERRDASEPSTDPVSNGVDLRQFPGSLVEDANLDKVRYRENYDTYKYDLTSPRAQGLHVTSGTTSMELRLIVGALKSGGVYREDTDEQTAEASMTCAENGDTGMVKGHAKDQKTLELANGDIGVFVLSQAAFDFDFRLGGNNGGEWRLELLGYDHGHPESDVCDSFDGDFNVNQGFSLTSEQRVHGTAIGCVFANGVQEFVDLVYGFPSPLAIYVRKWDEDFFKPFEPH